MQISDEIIKVLEYLGMKLGIVIDWTGENVLPYMEQLITKFITWEISTSFAWMAIMGAATIISLIFAIIINSVNQYSDGFEWLVFGALLVITIVVCGFQIFDIIECKVFPEKAIYDYIKNYINMHK